MNTSTNPFADPSIPSLAWVRDQIAVRYDLGHQVRMDLISACNKTGEWFGLPLSAVPASAAFLRAKFKRLHPAHVSVSARRIGNVRSLLLRAFREIGLSTALMPYGCAMTLEWQRLFDAMENGYHKNCLSRLMRFCSRQNIAPHEVNDDVLGRFLEALEKESLIENPRCTHQSACRCWNLSIDEVEGWPQSPVTVPSYQTRIYALPDKHFHPDLLRQIEDYLEHLQGRSLRSGPPRPLKTRSIAAVRGNLRRYLSALHYTGFVVASVRDLREVVDFAVFERAMTWFLERNGGKTSRSIGETAWTVRVLAVKYLGVDEETERLFGNAVSRLRVRHSGLSPKNRVALAQFDDPDAVRRYLLLPDRLWETAETASGKEARLRAESAVAIELLIYAPIRFTNLRTMRIDTHLSWIGGRLHLRFAEHEVKNGEPLHFILPTFVGRRIREFLDRYRGEYLDEPNLHPLAAMDDRKTRAAFASRSRNRCSTKPGSR
jgi:hypothetical protein